MRQRSVRAVMALVIVGSALVGSGTLRADEDQNPSPKCECYSWFGFHGVYQLSQELPVMFCAKVDCWVPLVND